jgi:hypothetical protein
VIAVSTACAVPSPLTESPALRDDDDFRGSKENRRRGVGFFNSFSLLGFSSLEDIYLMNSRRVCRVVDLLSTVRRFGVEVNVTK